MQKEESVIITSQQAGELRRSSLFQNLMEMAREDEKDRDFTSVTILVVSFKVYSTASFSARGPSLWEGGRHEADWLHCPGIAPGCTWLRWCTEVLFLGLSLYHPVVMGGCHSCQDAMQGMPLSTWNKPPPLITHALSDDVQRKWSWFPTCLRCVCQTSELSAMSATHCTSTNSMT